MLGSKTFTFGPRLAPEAIPALESVATSAVAASVRRRRIDTSRRLPARAGMPVIALDGRRPLALDLVQPDVVLRQRSRGRLRPAHVLELRALQLRFEAALRLGPV